MSLKKIHELHEERLRRMRRSNAITWILMSLALLAFGVYVAAWAFTA